jgi:hypothetical protein
LAEETAKEIRTLTDKQKIITDLKVLLVILKGMKSIVQQSDLV